MNDRCSNNFIKNAWGWLNEPSRCTGHNTRLVTRRIAHGRRRRRRQVLSRCSFQLHSTGSPFTRAFLPVHRSMPMTNYITDIQAETYKLLIGIQKHSNSTIFVWTKARNSVFRPCYQPLHTTKHSERILPILQPAPCRRDPRRNVNPKPVPNTAGQTKN